MYLFFLAFTPLASQSIPWLPSLLGAKVYVCKTQGSTGFLPVLLLPAKGGLPRQKSSNNQPTTSKIICSGGIYTYVCTHTCIHVYMYNCGILRPGPVFDNCEFLRPPWDGGGEWEVDGRNFILCCSAVGPVLDNCGFLRHPWDGEGRGEGSGK